MSSQIGEKSRNEQETAMLEVEELLAKGSFVVLFCLLSLLAGVFFAKAGRLPSVYLGLGVIAGGKSFFFANGADPVFHCCLVSGLHLIEIGDFSGHRSPR